MGIFATNTYSAIIYFHRCGIIAAGFLDQIYNGTILLLELMALPLITEIVRETLWNALLEAERVVEARTRDSEEIARRNMEERRRRELEEIERWVRDIQRREREENDRREQDNQLWIQLWHAVRRWWEQLDLMAMEQTPMSEICFVTNLEPRNYWFKGLTYFHPEWGEEVGGDNAVTVLPIYHYRSSFRKDTEDRGS
ncbi:hypothetical protein BDZ45DRAFT_727202 [Acephala macrosclerotiorum]|nr:hypothetical protein BDZ45DRAFT_727202 [Acephala macrosclerotiorum]